MKAYARLSVGISAVALNMVLVAPGWAQAQMTTDPAATQSVAPNGATPSPQPQTPPNSEPGAPLPDAGDIIVTARKVAEPLQKAPVAVTAFTQDQLREREIRQPQDLNIATPSLIVTPSAQGNSANYTIRGLSVGGAVYFAGAPGGAGRRQFYDLANVQVVNGPQGTLFGRTSTGGAVLYEPNRPTFDVDAMAQVGFGNYGYKRFDGMINVPLVSDVLAVRAAGYVLRRDGYTTSFVTGQHLDDQHQESFRIGVTFNPIQRLKTYTLLQYNNTDENGPGAVTRDYKPSYLLSGSLPIYNLPGFVAPFVFGGICQAEAARAGVAGNVAFVNGCVAQRTAIVTTIGNQLASEAARLAGGSDEAIRHSMTGDLGSYHDRNWAVVNNSTFDLGGSGFLSNASIKNIFAYSWTSPRPASFQDLDGIPGHLLEIQAGQSATPVLGTCSTSGATIGQCTTPVQGRALGDPTQHQLSEEVNVGATLFGRLDLLGGYFRLHQRTNGNPGLLYSAYGNVFSLGLAPAAPQRFYGSTSDEEGEFISGNLDLSDWLLRGLKVGAGFRHTRLANSSTNDTAAGSGIPSTLAYSDKGNSRQFTVDWQATNRILLYFRSGTGFTPGGVNTNCIVAPSATCPQQYKKQNAVDYEVGTKVDWNLGPVRLRTNAAVYKTDFTDIQTSIYAPNANNQIAIITINVASAQIKGFELSQAVNYKGLSVSANYSLTDSKYGKYFGQTDALPVCSDPYNNSANDCASFQGQPIANSAKHKFGLLASLALPTQEGFGTIRPSVQASYIGRILFGRSVTADPFSDQGGYWLFNGRVDWNNVAGLPIDAAIFGRNLFNKKYATQILPLYTNRLFGFNSVLYGEPTTYGIELRYRFGAGARH